MRKPYQLLWCGVEIMRKQKILLDESKLSRLFKKQMASKTKVVRKCRSHNLIFLYINNFLEILQAKI